MNLLLTAGGTREAIDPVRYLGNRSSGRLGAAVAFAAVAAGHRVTLIVGPGGVEMPAVARRVDVVSAADMLAAVLAELPAAAALIMAAAVADYRPIAASLAKIESGQKRLVIECEPTADILAAVAAVRRADQRVVGFSLQTDDDLGRAWGKLARKKLDLIVHNQQATLDSGGIDATLLYATGRVEELGYRTKAAFAEELVRRVVALVGPP